MPSLDVRSPSPKVDRQKNWPGTELKNYNWVVSNQSYIKCTKNLEGVPKRNFIHNISDDSNVSKKSKKRYDLNHTSAFEILFKELKFYKTIFYYVWFDKKSDLGIYL